MTKEEAKDLLLEIKNGALWKLNIQIAFDKAIKALENQCPSKGVDCEDCHADEPKAKVGKWINNGTQDSMIGEEYKCSICNEEFILDHNFNYCPNCGAKMEVEE